MNNANTEFAAVTEALIESIDAFRQLLETETQALASAGAADLTALVEHKLAQAEHLEQLERESRALLAQMGFHDISRRAMLDALCSLPGGEALSARWQAAMAGLERCLQLNTEAGTVIRLQAQRTQRSLEILSGSEARSVTYGPDGLENAAPRQSLAKA